MVQSIPMLDYPIDTRKRRKVPRWFTYLIFWGLVILVGWRGLLVKTEPTLSPVPEDVQAATSFTSIFKKAKKPEDLKAKIQEAARDWTNYSIVVVDYKSSFRMDINDTVIYTAASVNKLPILAALYYYSEKGDIDLDKVITIQAADIQDYGTGTIQYDPPGTTYSIRTLAQLMIKKSDNTAAYVLANHIVGIKKIHDLMASWGLTQTDVVVNKTSNRDTSLLVNKMWNRQVVGEALTTEMMGFMKDTDFENRLPSLLPEGVAVYHKIGTEVRVIHDVGVVTDGKVTYYIGVLTSDVPDEAEAETRIAEISKLVYDFMR
jgi:beta-lactamase class A